MKAFDGTENAVGAFVGASFLKTMKEMGMKINPGDNPPNVEGSYRLEPLVLENSNVPGESPGKSFIDMDFSYTDENNGEHTIFYSYKEGTTESGAALGSIISGGEEKFTVFLKIEVEISRDTADLIQVYSGRKVDDGFKDYQDTNFMVDDRDAPEGRFLKNGQGRILVDADGFVEEKQ